MRMNILKQLTDAACPFFSLGAISNGRLVLSRSISKNIRQLVSFCVVATIVAFITFGFGSMAHAAVETTQGKLPDDTPYRIDVPDNWNGTVLIGLDYAGLDPAQPRAERAEFKALLERGYALAGTTRTVTGWAIHLAAANAIRTLDLFEAKYGKPKHAIEFGSSMGGHTAAVSVQAYPDRWNGAVAQCGGLAGSVAQWQAKFDALFVAKTLLAPDSDLPIINIPKDWQTTALPAWHKMFDDAVQTPAGRARIALAAMLGQLPDWGNPDKPRPQPDDLEARETGLIESLATARVPLLNQAIGSRYQIETLAGGNISSNVDVDYAKTLRKIDQEGLIAKLYKKAGLNLKDDLNKLAKAPRVSADLAARAYVATGVFDGNLKIPMLTISGIGDPISSVAGQQFYGAAVKAAGKESMLRQVYTASAGHCGFTPAELVTTVQTLISRIETGVWPNTDPVEMNKVATATELGTSRFISYVPPTSVRTYTACDLERDLKTAGVEGVHAEGQALPMCIQSLKASH